MVNQKENNNNFYGKKHTKETKKLMSNIKNKNPVKYWKGKHLSEETKRKLSEGRIGIKYSNRKKCSEEDNKKMGLKRRGIRMSPKTEFKKGNIPWTKGKKHSEDTKFKIKTARALQIIPIKDTTIEVKIQNFIKKLNIDFLTHQYIKEIEHGYQCDILIPSMNLVIECDGNYWHKYPIGNNIDNIRTSELIEKGFNVLRLWENEIRIMDFNNFKNILFNQSTTIPNCFNEERQK